MGRAVAAGDTNRCPVRGIPREIITNRIGDGVRLTRDAAFLSGEFLRKASRLALGLEVRQHIEVIGILVIIGLA